MNEGNEDGGSAFAYFAASAVKKVISHLKSDNQLMGQQKRLRTRCSNKAQILKESGLPEDTQIKDGIMLNNLDDWKSVRDQLTN